MNLLATAATALALAVPQPSVQATAPLTVEFRAAGEAAFYRWDFGDGETGSGPIVRHAYARPGVYEATLTTDAGEARVQAVAYRVAFEAPRRARFGAIGRFTGSIWPAVPAAPVEISGPGGTIVRGKTRRNGGFVLRALVRGTGPFRARVAGLVTEESSVRLRPAIDARLVGAGVVGEPFRLVASVHPTGAGKLSVAVWRNGQRVETDPFDGRLDLRAARPASYRLRLQLEPADGYLPAGRTIRTAVVRPALGPGSRGGGVRALQRRLQELHYALPGVDGAYGLTTFQAVLAFQTVEGLPRTGRIDEEAWRRLAGAHVPRARYPGTHLEVSKGGQYLLDVVGGRVELVVHVSTGATGNTPIGHWRIYRKVVGWSWVLWYPMYFLRGFAVHGYPEVPAHPASHGCVRVPMWVATRLFREHAVGQSVYVYP